MEVKKKMGGGGVCEKIEHRTPKKCIWGDPKKYEFGEGVLKKKCVGIDKKKKNHGGGGGEKIKIWGCIIIIALFSYFLFSVATIFCSVYQVMFPGQRKKVMTFSTNSVGNTIPRENEI